MRLGYLAIDQYGETIKLKKHPRKELMEYFGVKHADKMFIDTRKEEGKHIGYVIAGHWFRIYEINEWNKEG